MLVIHLPGNEFPRGVRVHVIPLVPFWGYWSPCFVRYSPIWVHFDYRIEVSSKMLGRMLPTTSKFVVQKNLGKCQLPLHHETAVLADTDRLLANIIRRYFSIPMESSQCTITIVPKFVSQNWPRNFEAHINIFSSSTCHATFRFERHRKRCAKSSAESVYSDRPGRGPHGLF